MALHFRDGHWTEKGHDNEADDIRDLDSSRYSERRHQQILRAGTTLSEVASDQVDPETLAPSSFRPNLQTAQLSYVDANFRSLSSPTRAAHRRDESQGQPPAGPSGNGLNIRR